MPSIQSHITRFVIRKFVAPNLMDPALPISEQRKKLSNMQKLSVMPLGVTTQKLTVAGLKGLWITPKNCDQDRVILYLHGGGYNIGSIESHKEMAARLAKSAKAKILLIDYRLAPEHPYPAALNDAKRAYRWLLESGNQAKDICIAGDSAGGGLTLATAIALRNDKIEMPACLCTFSPWTDVAMTGETMQESTYDPMLNVSWIKQMADGYSQGKDLSEPTLSPLYDSFSALPPMLIHVGSDELLLSDSTRFAKRAKAAGVDVDIEVWPRMWHVWHLHAGFMPESKQAISDAGAYIAKKIPNC